MLPGCLPTPGLRVASDRPTGGAHDWLKSAAGRATGSELRTRKSLIRLDFIEHKSERSVMPQDTGVGRNVVLDGLDFASLRRVWEQTFGATLQARSRAFSCAAFSCTNASAGPMAGFRLQPGAFWPPW